MRGESFPAPSESSLPPPNQLLFNDILLQRLDKIDAAIEKLLRQETTRPYYTTAEVAKLLGKAEFTVRQWCLISRINAVKQRGGRWVISHEELQRYLREGLLPLRDGER